MVDISDIDGWKDQGSLAGDDIHKIIGEKPGTGAVLHIKISGPTRYQSTTYSVAVQLPGETFPETYIERGIETKEKAELVALEYARKN